MTVQSDRSRTWDDVDLPCVLRYRKRAFILHFIVSAGLFLGAGACVASFGSLVAGLPLAVMGVLSLALTIIPMLHVRQIDEIQLDTDGLTLVSKDGGFLRIPFEPDLQFSVTYEQCCRSIVVSSSADKHCEREHVVADVLDVPRGQTIYGLCQLLNDLSSGHARGAIGPRLGVSTVHRRQDWFREPLRLSRLMFLAGMLGLGALFLCVMFVLTLTSSAIDWSIGKPVVFIVKFGLSMLFTYPAMRFLAVARLRDLGEPATHQNAMGLVWNSGAGSPLRLFLRRGQRGRNPFGPEPRF